MIKNEYNVIGVMSGTSLDGIDLAHIYIKYQDTWTFEIKQYETHSYEKEWVNILQDLVVHSQNNLNKIDIDYTKYLAATISRFIKQNQIQNIDAVCSHGHTALHQPEKGLTYQIGNLSILASLINIKVICDFRVQDVKLGGQGAPLVPIGDALLFDRYDFCLNLGGFANISYDENQRIAYDICPVNIVLNHYARQLGFNYDNRGEIASSGIVNTTLLKALNALPFFSLKHPKSLGLEWVNTNVFSLIDYYGLEAVDVLRTYVEHIAIQITKVLNLKKQASVFVTGGGAFNDYLIDRIKSFTSNSIIRPSDEIINYKEALIFGFLGVLKMRNEVNCLASVTGAKYDHSSGEIYHP